MIGGGRERTALHTCVCVLYVCMQMCMCSCVCMDVCLLYICHVLAFYAQSPFQFQLSFKEKLGVW